MNDVEHAMVVRAERMVGGVQDANAAARELREQLKAGLAKKRGFDVTTLAIRSELGRTTVSQALNSTDQVPSERTVGHLARALGLDADLLLQLQRAACAPKPADRLRAPVAGGDPDTPTDTVAVLGPGALEVHNAVAAGRAAVPSAELTKYLPRMHDAELRGMLAAVLAGGGSRLIMLTGESSTGKTRALYEALLDLAPSAPLLRPVDRGELLDLLEGGRVRPGCVLWLNEAQQFLFDADGERAAGRLRAVLERTAGIAAVGTMWTNPFWTELTAYARPSDPHSQARALLTHPGFAVRIAVPAHLAPTELKAWRHLADSGSDPRLRQALDAGAGDGRVIQHLSGGPELLTAYLAGPGPLFTPKEHALITAALDARRLGHLGPLPAALLADAADGDLPPRHRSSDPDWVKADLHALATGRRADGTRTDIRNTLTALTPIYPYSGALATYEPTDYLDQHTRRLRADQPGSPALWHALIEHSADRDDQSRLAHAAWNRGLRTTAIRLWNRAAAAGHPTVKLVNLGHSLDPDGAAAVFTAAHADLGAPGLAVGLLEMWMAGNEQAVATLLARDPAAHVDLTDPRAAARVLDLLRGVGDARGLAMLLARNPAAHADVTNPSAVADLLERLRNTGDVTGAATLAVRAADQSDLTDPTSVAFLLDTLRNVGDEQGVRALLARDPAAHADLAEPLAVTFLLRLLKKAGDEQGVATLLARDPAAHAHLKHPTSTARLLEGLRKAGDEQAARALALRAANFSDLADPRTAADLLDALRKAGEEQAVATLLARDPATHADLTHTPFAVGRLLRALRAAGDERSVRALLARDPATHADLTSLHAVAMLLKELRTAGDEQAARALAARAVTYSDPSKSIEVPVLLEALREGGDKRATALLAARAAEHADLAHPHRVATLLKGLRKAGDEQAIATLLARGPAAHADLSDSDAIADLSGVLQEVGDEEAVATLDARAENAGHYPERFAPYGHEPDGKPSRPWTWKDLTV